MTEPSTDRPYPLSVPSNGSKPRKHPPQIWKPLRDSSFSTLERVEAKEASVARKTAMKTKKLSVPSNGSKPRKLAGCSSLQTCSGLSVPSNGSKPRKLHGDMGHVRTHHDLSVPSNGSKPRKRTVKYILSLSTSPFSTLERVEAKEATFCAFRSIIHHSFSTLERVEAKEAELCATNALPCAPLLSVPSNGSKPRKHEPPGIRDGAQR